jgi:hypothetical protein
MNNKGSTILITPIIWVITIFVFIFFMVFSVKIMEPFMIYQKISATTLKYIFIIEDFGYLNREDKEELVRELTNKGLIAENIIVEATDEAVDYGDVVELSVIYDYPYKKASFETSFIPKYKEEIIKICVSKKGVSKR